MTYTAASAGLEVPWLALSFIGASASHRLIGLQFLAFGLMSSFAKKLSGAKQGCPAQIKDFCLHGMCCKAPAAHSASAVPAGGH